MANIEARIADLTGAERAKRRSDIHASHCTVTSLQNEHSYCRISHGNRVRAELDRVPDSQNDENLHHENGVLQMLGSEPSVDSTSSHHEIEAPSPASFAHDALVRRERQAMTMLAAAAVAVVTLLAAPLGLGILPAAVGACSFVPLGAATVLEVALPA